MTEGNKQYVVSWSYSNHKEPCLHRIIDLTEIEKQQVINILEENHHQQHLEPIRKLIVHSKFRSDPLEVYIIEVEESTTENDLLSYFSADPSAAAENFKTNGIDIVNYSSAEPKNLS